jgi:hypothetical protein
MDNWLKPAKFDGTLIKRIMHQQLLQIYRLYNIVVLVSVKRDKKKFKKMV